MKYIHTFSDQDTAIEFCRILRNLERYQIVRGITGGIRKSNSLYPVGYSNGRWGARNHVVSLLHKGNGAVRVAIGSIDRGHPAIVLTTVCATDSFVEGVKLREAIQSVAYFVNLFGHSLRGTDLVANLEALATVDDADLPGAGSSGRACDRALLKRSRELSAELTDNLTVGIL